MKHKLIRLTFALICMGICTIQAQVHLVSATRMEVDAHYDSTLKGSMLQVMNSYKIRLNQEVSRSIGVCAQFMTAKAPESLLSNFLADQLFAKASELTPGGVDFSVINIGSIRAPLNSGTLTVGDLCKVMPFENELVILELKGSDVVSIFEGIARAGGEGVSNVQLEIRGKKIHRLLIGGNPPENSKLYRVATMDYLAEGNGGFTPFLKAVNRTKTGLKVRDIYLEKIEKLTAQGKAVDSGMDGRIKIFADENH